MWLVMIMRIALMAYAPSSVICNANLRTLRMFSMQVCDGEELRIECMPDTVISISRADYGKPVAPDMQCLEKVTNPLAPQTGCWGHDIREHITKLCKESQECNLEVSPKLLTTDTCSTHQKYLDISYKCRPNKFFTRFACENEKLRLRCHNKNLRIIIYSASFGSERSGASECPATKNKRNEDCTASFATETAMEGCHGRRKCTLSADTDAFGVTNCSNKANLFLKVIYTCVPIQALQDLELQEESDSEQDYPAIFRESGASEVIHNMESLEKTTNLLTTLPTDTNAIFADFNITTTKKVDVQSDETSFDGTDVNCTTADDNQKVIGFLTEWIAAYKFIKQNKEKFILYVTVSIGAGLLLFLVVLSIRLYMQQRRATSKARLHVSEPLPLAFDDAELERCEVVRYTDTSTVRRQDSGSHPRAPLSHSMNNYYYS